MGQNEFEKMFSEPPFRDAFADINEYTQELLEKYLSEIRDSDLTKNRKEIYDAIWGSIEFNSAEMILIDSPLLQRLKQIRQLGLSDFVYPGSAYSRFYHTLGVTSLSSRMAIVLNSFIKEKYGGIAEDNQKTFYQLIRYAAILHDVGHMLFSHASEQFFAENEASELFVKTNEMLTTFLRKTGYNAALHELLSCMIVNSSAVKEMIYISLDYSDYIQTRRPTTQLLDQFIEYITCLIVGVPVDRYILPYSKIINGPVDSDKCDYLTRDSYVTKVPVAVDVSRLIQKLRLVVVESKDINFPEIWHDSAAEEIPYLEFAVTNAAEKTLFQLCMARNTMYGSVYYHQKVLTVETMFRDILKHYQSIFPGTLGNFSEIFRLSDDFLGCTTIQTLQRFIQNETNPARKQTALTIVKKMKALQTRTLCKRVLKLSFGHLRGTSIDINIFWNKVITTSELRQQEKLLSRIKAEYIELFKRVNQTIPENVEIFLVQQPMVAYDHTKIKVYIDLENNQHRSYRGYSYLESKESNDKEYLLVTNQKDRDLFMLAAEKVLFEDYRIQFIDESFACLKYSIEEIESRRQYLFLEGYYDGSCYPLITDRLLRHYIPSASILEIVRVSSIYEGAGGQIDKTDVENFFKQFMACCEQKDKVRELLAGIKELLLKATYVGRVLFTKTFVRVLKDIGLSHYTICNVGSKLDSSAHFAYFLNDVQEDLKGITVVDKLDEYLTCLDADGQIIFFDDGAYSGKQIVSVFQEYMGISKDLRTTSEKHAFELKDELKETFKKLHIILFFICFNKDNMDYIMEEFTNMGFNHVDVRYGYEMDSGLFDRQTPIVKATLKSIGKALVASQKGGKQKWDTKRIEEAALGYNNARQMVFLKSSVPTYTVTPFWFRGRTDNGMEWTPLFTRTIKPD